MWHGCSPGSCYSICKGGAKDLRQTDGGFFGGGIYLTPDCEYAADYSTGSLSLTPVTPNERGEFTILLCLTVVGLTYPISRKTDYDFPDEFQPWSICKYHCSYPISAEAIQKAKNNDTSLINKALQIRNDKTLFSGFDSHFVCVARRFNYQAARVEDEDFSELVVKEEGQVLPLAVVYFKNN